MAITFVESERKHIDFALNSRFVGYPSIEVVDLDSNNNDIVDGGDEANFLSSYGSMKGDSRYNRQFDANFDDTINELDYEIFYKTLGKRLDVIRSDIKTGIYEHLTWPDGWDAYISAVNKDEINEFTGVDGEEGWISIRQHPYMLSPTPYYCQQFASDTAVASYKGLGYGCILPASSAAHAYSIFWSGGGWHNLANWWVLEPQCGVILANATSPALPSNYCTTRIWLPERYTGYVVIAHILTADYMSRTVDYGEFMQGIDARNNEEPVPSTFNRTLGIGD